MTTGIYKITNTQTQKSYIGQSENIEARIGSHLTDCFGKGIQRELYTALRQFGINNFTFEIIEECPTHLLDEKEAFRGIQHTVKGFTFEYVEDCENG